jgi:hypothetical protein
VERMTKSQNNVYTLFKRLVAVQVCTWHKGVVPFVLSKIMSVVPLYQFTTARIVLQFEFHWSRCWNHACMLSFYWTVRRSTLGYKMSAVVQNLMKNISHFIDTMDPYCEPFHLLCNPVGVTQAFGTWSCRLLRCRRQCWLILEEQDRELRLFEEIKRWGAAFSRVGASTLRALSNEVELVQGWDAADEAFSFFGARMVRSGRCIPALSAWKVWGVAVWDACLKPMHLPLKENMTRGPAFGFTCVSISNNHLFSKLFYLKITIYFKTTILFQTSI